MKKKTTDRIFIGLMIALGLALIIVMAFPDKSEPEPAPAQPAFQERMVHIDGFDKATMDIITPLNVWSNYEKRTRAFTINHGETVTMIGRTTDGNGVKIRDSRGREGWITYFLIKELK